MAQTVTVAGSDVELPRYDMAMARRVEALDAADGAEATWRAEWELARAAVGADELRDAVGGDRVESCDLTALDALCADIRSAYDAPRMEATRRRIAEALSVLDGADLDRLVKASETMASLGSRQGFRRVR